MVRKILRTGVVATLGLIAMLATVGAASTADDKVPDISTIMSKSFGKGGLKMTIATDVKGEKWEDAAKLAKDFEELGSALGKNKPPKGDPKSWDDLTKKFAESAKAVHEAADKKDPKAVKDAMATINCGNCHKAHKQ